jgi:hypothetical protein
VLVILLVLHEHVTLKTDAGYIFQIINALTAFRIGDVR